MHLINLTSILLIAVNYLFSHFIPHTYFFRSSFIWFVYDILYILVNLYLCVVVVVLVFSIGIVMFLRYFGHIWHCSISNSLIPISNSILKTSNCLQTDTFIIQMFFALKSCMDTHKRLWLRLRQRRKKTSEWIQFKARIHSLYQFAHTQFYCMEYRGDLLLCYFVLTTKNFQTKLTSTLQRRWTQTLKSEKKAFRNYNLSKHIVEKRNGIEIWKNKQQTNQGNSRAMWTYNM